MTIVYTILRKAKQNQSAVCIQTQPSRIWLETIEEKEIFQFSTKTHTEIDPLPNDVAYYHEEITK